jgi:hypothetical protein
MKRLVTVFTFVCIFAIEGCKNENEELVPELPVISTSSLELIDGGGNVIGNADTLRLTFEFTDGIFDYGLNPEVTYSPFHRLNFFYAHNWTDQKFPIKAAPFLNDYYIVNRPFLSTQLVTFEFLRAIGQSPQFSCWEFMTASVAVKVQDGQMIINQNRIVDTITVAGLQEAVFILKDTFLFEHNRSHNNLFVEYLVEQANGSFKMFDFKKEFCQTDFNARVPEILGMNGRTGPFEVKTLSNQKVKISYKMANAGLRGLFGGKRIKLRVSIIDRSLNESNVVETETILVPTK